LHIIYVWGDCYHLGCRDPSEKHGFLGVIVEILSDILLAIVFELFFGLENALARWIADLRNYEYRSDYVFCVEVIKLGLCCLERLGFIGSLAFAFVPQWTEPRAGESIALNADCSDLFMGSSSFNCLQRRLPLEQRRLVFEALTKGPFCVAPFVSIIVKVIVPLVVHKLVKISHRPKGSGILESLRCVLFFPWRGLYRILSVIFVYDCDVVNRGCCSYILRGRPFRKIEPCSVDLTGSELEISKRALSQAQRKVLEPADELLELQMSFLWVVFLMPIRPEGVLITLVARIMAIHFGLVKILYVRRRPFPTSDKVMRQVHSSFMLGVMMGSIGWTTGLSFLTYNDDIWRWGVWGRVAMVSIYSWWVLSVVVVMLVYNSIGASLALDPSSFKKPKPGFGTRPSPLPETE